MTDRERLIELLKGDSCPSPYRLCDESCKYAYLERCFEERTADYLLAHGVTVREPGRWKKRKSWKKAVCGNYSFESEEESRYCPICGAPMK